MNDASLPRMFLLYIEAGTAAAVVAVHNLGFPHISKLFNPNIVGVSCFNDASVADVCSWGISPVDPYSPTPHQPSFPVYGIS